MVEAEPSFDAPLPGMSLTAEVGSRPWQNPPKYATVDEVVDHYVTRMVTPSRTEELLDIMTKEEKKEHKLKITLENKERRSTKTPKHIKKRAEKRNKK